MLQEKRGEQQSCCFGPLLKSHKMIVKERAFPKSFASTDHMFQGGNSDPTKI